MGARKPTKSDTSAPSTADLVAASRPTSLATSTGRVAGAGLLITPENDWNNQIPQPMPLPASASHSAGSISSNTNTNNGSTSAANTRRVPKQKWVPLPIDLSKSRKNRDRIQRSRRADAAAAAQSTHNGNADGADDGQSSDNSNTNQAQSSQLATATAATPQSAAAAQRRSITTAAAGAPATNGGSSGSQASSQSRVRRNRPAATAGGVYRGRSPTVSSTSIEQVARVSAAGPAGRSVRRTAGRTTVGPAAGGLGPSSRLLRTSNNVLNYADYPTEFRLANKLGKDTPPFLMPYMGTFYYDGVPSYNTTALSINDAIKKQM